MQMKNRKKSKKRNMKITIDDTIKDDLHTVEVENEGTVEDLKVLVEVVAGVPIDDQLLMFQNSFLEDNTSKLKHLGITNGEIIVLQKNFRPPPTMAPAGQAPQNDFLNRFFSSLDSDGAGGPPASPGMGGFGGSGGVNPLANLDQIPGIAGLDPLSEEYQQKLEEHIKQKNINENATYAQNYNPELYTHTTMLYIECSINGNEIQAFVDSGAQSTIMSKRCAEKCNLMKLLDTRFQGVAQGVGTSKILGRIHAAQIQISNVFFTTSLTILEDNKVDMLYGLDNLKRHRCCIDLDKNELTLDQGKVAVPFLKDHQIVRGFGDEESKDGGAHDSRSNEEKLTDLMGMGYDEKE